MLPAKRWQWWALVGSLLLLVVALIVAAVRPRGVAWEDYQRIRPGMTRAEVESISGCSPGDYRSGETKDVHVPFDHWKKGGRFGRESGGLSKVEWLTDTAGVVLWFDSAGKVRAGLYAPFQPATSNPLENLVWRLKRQWDRWFGA